jgi:hypothetical protein
LTATIGRAARGLAACSARATSSLPVPVSPVISTASGVGPTRAISPATAAITGEALGGSAAGARRSCATTGTARLAATARSAASRGGSAGVGRRAPRYSAPAT